jgi:hypothetical protein
LPKALGVYDNTDRWTPEIERRLLTKLRLPNGTYKTTYQHRLDDINETLLAFLPSDRSLNIMDVGVSSGQSTVEWSDHLHEHGFPHRLVAGDLATEAWVIHWGAWLGVLFDRGGRDPLLLSVGPMILPLRSDRWLAKLARPLLFPILRAVAAVARRARAATSVSPGNGLTYRPVPLVTPELGRRPVIELVQDDITLPGRFPLAFDVIRVANLVQRAYFDDGTLRTIVVNLRDRLRNGGLLVIGRTTEDGVNHATIFRRAGDRLVSEVLINGGTEVSDIVAALR